MAEQASSNERQSIGKFLAAAVGTTILLNVIVLLLPLMYKDFFYDTIEFLWPVLSMLLLMRAFMNEKDSSIKRLISLFTVAMICWSLTVLLWEVVLPLVNASDAAYYMSGFGYFLAYLILIYALVEIRQSRQWYLSSSANIFTNIIVIIAIVGAVIIIVPGIHMDEPRALDMVILLAYIICDIVIVTLCGKLMNVDLSDEMKYVVCVVGVFTMINFLGDALFEFRWLLHESTILSFKISTLTDVIYTASMVFVTIATLFYLSSSRDRVLSTISRKLNSARPYVQDIIANSPDAMFICDEDGRLAITNEPMAKLLNMDRSGLVGKFNFFEYLCAVDEHMAPVVEQIKRGESFRLPKMKFPDMGNHSSVYVSLRLFPMRDDKGNIACFAGIIQDITDQLRNEQELAESKKQIELYMDIMSHDINNINQIGMGHLELARARIDSEGKLEPEYVHYIDKPMEAFINSSRLISNIRMIKKVRSGEVLFEPVDIGEVLEDIVSEHKGSVDRSVVINYQPSRGLRVKANNLLREVFSNLVGNAIKHSDPEKPLVIDIQTGSIVRDGRKFYRVLIEDDGKGVPDVSKEAIFNRIQTGPVLHKNRGLGLYIVRSLVESYGGKVWVEDRLPGSHTSGAKFVVELPADDQAQA